MNLLTPRGVARRGYTLFEVMVAVGLFLMLLTTTFLPFKIMRDASNKGSAREDLDEALRVTFGRMGRNLQQGCQMTFTSAGPAAGSFTSVTFSPFNNATTTTTYFSTQASGEPAGELALMETDTANGSSQTKTLVANGITYFYMTPQQYSTSVIPPIEYAYVTIYLSAYPSTANRPLPDNSMTPSIIATAFDVRNGADMTLGSGVTNPYNPYMYPNP